MTGVEKGNVVCRTCGFERQASSNVRCPVDGAALVSRQLLEECPDDPILGRVIANKFCVVGVIGRGGFGAVYRAIQEPVGRAVALKVISTRTSSSEPDALRARFFREAKVVAQLKDPCTVTLYDYGEETDGLLYMVFELIEGESLLQVVAQGPMPSVRVAPLLMQALGALSEAHSIGCVHRDLKPANLMVVRGSLGEETVKVLDFGIAKLTTADATDVHDPGLETREGTVIGTPKYMAPEQARALPVDARTDVYALGCLAYTMLSGRPPFNMANAMDVLMAQVHDAPPPFDPALLVPPAFSTIVMRALEKDPAARYASAGEMARPVMELVRALTGTFDRVAIEEVAARMRGAQSPTSDGPSGQSGLSGQWGLSGLAAFDSTHTMQALSGSTSKEFTASLEPRPPEAMPTDTISVAGAMTQRRSFGPVVAAVAVGVAFTFAWLRPASESAGVASGQPPAAQSPSGVPKVEKTAGSNAADPFSQALALAEAGNLAAAGVVVAELKATLNDAGVSALRLRIEGSPKLRPILARTEWQSTGVFQMDAGVKPPPAPLEPMSLQPRLAPSLAPSLARDPRVLRQPASPPAATSSEKLDVPEF